MPSKVTVVTGRILEGHDAFLTARVITGDGTPLVTGDITGNVLAVNVYDISAGGEGRRAARAIFTKTDISTTTGGPGGSNSVFNSYQTLYWDGKDGTGYNFVYQLQYDTAGSDGPYLRGGHRYQVEFSANTGTAFGTTRWYFILDVEPLYGV